MKVESRIVGSLLKVVPPLLTLAYAGGAQADPPEINVASCTLTPNTPIFSFPPDSAVDTLEPRIESNPAGTWTASAAAGECSGGGSAWNCAGLNVTLPAGPQAQTPDFVDDPAESVPAGEETQTLSVTVDGCETDFT